MYTQNENKVFKRNLIHHSKTLSAHENPKQQFKAVPIPQGNSPFKQSSYTASQSFSQSKWRNVTNKCSNQGV